MSHRTYIWSMGAFGHFPTHTLQPHAVQFFEQAKQELFFS